MLTENRFSRLEKARRKRRALVEQLAAQNATLNATADLNENKEMDDEEQESAMNKAAEKVERDAKLTAKSKEAHANLMETAGSYPFFPPLLLLVGLSSSICAFIMPCVNFPQQFMHFVYY